MQVLKRNFNMGDHKTFLSFLFFTLIFSVIGYNGGHYINYSRKGQFWYKFDDSHYHEIGVYNDMLSDMAE